MVMTLLKRFVSTIAASTLVAALSACGGGGGGGDSPPASGTGTLVVNISGLPAGTNAAVTVSGQSSYSRALAQSTTLTDVPVGNATVSAAAVQVGATSYGGTVSGSPASIATGTPRTVSVTYATGTVPSGTGVTVSGTARFDSVPIDPATNGLNYNAITAKAIRGALVEVISSPSGTVLASTTTGEDGKYSVEIGIGSASNVLVRVRAQMFRSGTPSWDFRVVDNTSGGALYALESAPKAVSGNAVSIDLQAASGWGGTGYTTKRASAPFAVLDTVYQAVQKVLSASPQQVWPRLNLNWSIENRPTSGDKAQGLIGTSHFVPGADANGALNLYLLGRENLDTDEFDRHVVAHEFGHYIQSFASRSDSTGGPHSGEPSDMRLAFGEGFGDGWSAIALGDPRYVDTSDARQATGRANPINLPLSSGAGWYREDTVSYLFYKFNEQLGFTPVWQALTGSTMRTTNALTSIHLYASALKEAAPAQTSAINSLLATQGITVVDAFGANETNNGGNPDVLPLYRAASIGATIPMCVTLQANDFPNNLGNFAFARLTVPTARSTTITLSGGTDPDFRLLRVGASPILAQSFAAQQERLTVNLAAGTYIIEATEAAVAGRTCLTLTVN